MKNKQPARNQVDEHDRGSRSTIFPGSISRSLQRMSRPSLDNLIAALEVDFARLAECLLSPGSRLAINGNGALGIHYSLADRGG